MSGDNLPTFDGYEMYCVEDRTVYGVFYRDYDGEIWFDPKEGSAGGDEAVLVSDPVVDKLTHS